MAKKVKLLCIPYAGGNAQFYNKIFSKHIADYIEIVPIELPGHSMRINEKLKHDMKDLVNDIINKVSVYINSEDEYALLGYSLGSRIIYCLYNEMVKRNWKLPLSMFICASPPPTLAEKSKILRRMI